MESHNGPNKKIGEHKFNKKINNKPDKYSKRFELFKKCLPKNVSKKIQNTKNSQPHQQTHQLNTSYQQNYIPNTSAQNTSHKSISQNIAQQNLPQNSTHQTLAQQIATQPDQQISTQQTSNQQTSDKQASNNQLTCQLTTLQPTLHPSKLSNTHEINQSADIGHHISDHQNVVAPQSIQNSNNNAVLKHILNSPRNEVNINQNKNSNKLQTFIVVSGKTTKEGIELKRSELESGPEMANNLVQQSVEKQHVAEQIVEKQNLPQQNLPQQNLSQNSTHPELPIKFKSIISQLFPNGEEGMGVQTNTNLSSNLKIDSSLKNSLQNNLQNSLQNSFQTNLQNSLQTSGLNSNLNYLADHKANFGLDRLKLDCSSSDSSSNCYSDL